MGPRGISVVAVALLVGALAAGGRAEEPKVYRWVGQDGRVYTSNAPPKDGKGLIDAQPQGSAAPAPGSIPAAPESDDDSCGRFGAYVVNWRSAQQSVESWEATIDRLQSRTDDFVRRNDTAYNESLERANQHLDEARERASRLEAEGRAAGMPQSCLTE
jgi:hypothetical protein